MRIIDLHHRPHNLAHYSVNNSAYHSNGSIMIWTVMLGLLLTSVFFFFSMRQRMMINIQRDTATTQNAKLLLESYADYFEKTPKEVSSSAEGLSIKLTQKVSSIENIVDFGVGKQQAYDFIGSGSVYVEWNRCSDSLKGDLLFNDVLYKHQTSSECAANEEYDDVVGPISVASPYTIKTLNAPFYFRIKPVAETQLIDNQWHLDLSEDLDYGKKIPIKRTF